MFSDHQRALLVILAAVSVSVPVDSSGQAGIAQCKECVGTTEMRCSDVGSQGSGNTGCRVVGGDCQQWGMSCSVSAGCFVSGTRVETPFGAVPIEELEVGDVVRASDTEGRLVYGLIEALHFEYVTETLLINGAVRTTGAHPFLVVSPRSEEVVLATATGSSHYSGDVHALGVWREAHELREADVLLRIDGSRVPIESITVQIEEVPVYNVSVRGYRTFFAEGFLVHNKVIIHQD